MHPSRGTLRVLYTPSKYQNAFVQSFQLYPSTKKKRIRHTTLPITCDCASPRYSCFAYEVTRSATILTAYCATISSKHVFLSLNLQAIASCTSLDVFSPFPAFLCQFLLHSAFTPIKPVVIFVVARVQSHVSELKVS